MTDYIDRKAAVKAVCQKCKACIGKRTLDCLEAKSLLAIPAADVVPVVRCADCKYCLKEDDYSFWCNGFCSPARLVTPDDFCSHGKRRE